MKLMKPFSASLWALLAVVVLLTLLLRAFLPYREGRAINIIIGLIVGSYLFWLKGRSRENRRSGSREEMPIFCPVGRNWLTLQTGRRRILEACQLPGAP